MKPEKRIELTNRLNPEAVALARWVCLATRIEPALIRRARLRLMPAANAGTESDLWFSPLIQTVGARYILFYPEVSNLLRRELSGNRKDFARAWKVTRQTHRALPELVRLEEKLTWLALKDDARLERKLDALLRPLIKAVLTGQREGLGRWALNVIPHLPERARASKSARLLRMIAESQLYGGWANLLTTIGDGPNDEEAALLLHGLERTTAGLRLRGNNLEVSEPPEEGARLIKVPATNPRVLELSWPHDDQLESARLLWNKGEQGRTVGIRLPLSVNTLAGDSHQLIQGTQIMESHKRMVTPYLVSILDADKQAAGLGILVENDFILTTANSIRNANPDGPDSVESQSVGFPLLPPERIAITRTAGSAVFFQRTISRSELVSTDYPILLKLDRPATGTHAAKLNSAFDLKGRVLLAPGISPGGNLEKWAAFEVGEATETGDFALIPATQINSDKLSRWSGAPLVDGSTGEVAGLLLVNKGEDARARVVSLDQISRAFPEIFNAGSTVLVSYSHRDSKHVEEFMTWMPKGSEDRIVYWEDSRINMETPWPEDMAGLLQSATAAVLFVSADYLASDFMVEDRLPQLLRPAEERGLVILPIIVGPSRFTNSTLARYQALNDPSKPLTTLSAQERDRVFERLSEILSKKLGVKAAERSTSQPEFSNDFFISYHQADSAWAEWIAWQLNEAGYSTFLLSRDLEAGSNFVSEMDRAMKQSARTVALLSPDFLDSEFTRQEWAAALLADPTDELPKLLPIRIREGELKGPWLSLTIIDLVGLSEQDATAVLLDGIRRSHPRLVDTDEAEKRSIEPVPFPIPAPASTTEPSQQRVIAKFLSDVYISYAHLDNQPFGDTKGWVDQFVEILRIRLGQLLGREPEIWFDMRLQDNQYFADELGSRLSATCLFVAIITPRYVNSEWCRGELREFHRRAAETGGVIIADHSRIFAVNKIPVPRENLPEEVKGFLGFEFYELDDQGRPREFSPELGPNKDQKYWDKLDDLTWHIKSTLERIKGSRTEPLLPEVMVYLAETASDLRGERESVRGELQARGYHVLPDQALPHKSPDYQNAVRECLVRTKLSIHLIGSSYGFLPEGEDERSVAVLQADLAAERAAADPSFSRLLWIPPGLHPKERRQQAFVERLQSSGGSSDELLKRPIEDLKTRIVERLGRLRPKPAPRQKQGNRLKQIYLICDERDRPWATPIRDYLFENHFEVTMSMESNDPRELMDHRQNLRESDAALIYYGSADEQWLKRNLEDLEKAYAYGREADWSATALYIGPPRTEQKTSFRTHPIRFVIRNFDEFTPDDLSDFVSAIQTHTADAR
jgi:hypothetical protein